VAKILALKEFELSKSKDILPEDAVRVMMEEVLELRDEFIARVDAAPFSKEIKDKKEGG